MIENFIHNIKTFVKLQRNLIKAFAIQYSGLKDWKFLNNFPKTGVVLLEGIEWNFQKHGSGLKFSNTETGECIDIHQYLELPECFDAWRLCLYFESKGVIYEESQLELELKRLVGENKITNIHGKKELYSLL